MWRCRENYGSEMILKTSTIGFRLSILLFLLLGVLVWSCYLSREPILIDLRSTLAYGGRWRFVSSQLKSKKGLDFKSLNVLSIYTYQSLVAWFHLELLQVILLARIPIHPFSYLFWAGKECWLAAIFWDQYYSVVQNIDKGQNNPSRNLEELIGCHLSCCCRYQSSGNI